VKLLAGDVWSLYDEGSWVVIPTNVGWRHDGSNVMGRGLARSAAQRFPHLPEWYGLLCRTGDHGLVAITDLRILCFPVKPLLQSAPHLSWDQKASPPLIERSAVELRAWLFHHPKSHVALPLVGCGNGGLHPRIVILLLYPILQREARVTLVVTPLEFQAVDHVWDQCVVN
jgi:hypothetical protein